MDPLFLQKQLRDNNADLQEYFKDIQSWGDEMKRKELALKSVEDKDKSSDVPLPRNKMPKKEMKNTHSESSKLKAPKVNTKVLKDFTYWEKFDVEAECEKIEDECLGDDSDLTDECDEAAVDMAQEEKEKGNKFVKSARWEDALKCYTKAIELYNYDATFYANRALCYLKLEQYKNAEADCTIALQLDKKYVKAMHRRAIAKEAMKQYNEAKMDLEMVMSIEPENKESQRLLDKIEKHLKGEHLHKPGSVQEQRPVSRFTASRQKQPVASTSKAETTSEDLGPAFKELIVERKKPESAHTQTVKDKVGSKTKSIPYVKIDSSIQWPAGGDVEIVKSFTKPPKDRSRVSLKRIEVECSMKFNKF